MSALVVCPACLKRWHECRCQVTCALCGVRTNHTTQAHKDALKAQEGREP